MLDFTKKEKRCLPIKLADKTQLDLCMPSKALFAKLESVESLFDKSNGIKCMYDGLTSLCADILSNNKTKTEFTAKQVEDLVDIEDMSLLIFEYAKYAGEAIRRPN